MRHRCGRSDAKLRAGLADEYRAVTRVAQHGPRQGAPQPGLALTLMSQCGDHVDQFRFLGDRRGFSSEGRCSRSNLTAGLRAATRPILLSEAGFGSGGRDHKFGYSNLTRLRPGDFLRVREAAALLPALIRGATSAGAVLTGKRLREILGRSRQPTDGQRKDGGAETHEDGEADQPASPVPSQYQTP